ncbi:MAG TPA: peptidylprolyl isomerase [Burkholderiaceae bacterium]|nr:peptidylprolyl isomerase [Burkholderiaceae bacterium]
MEWETLVARSARTLGLIVCLVSATAVFAQAADAPSPEPGPPAAAPGAVPDPAGAPSDPAATPDQAAASPAPASGGDTQPAPGKSSAATTRLVDRIVAVVNDEVITNNELQARLRVAEAQLRRQNIALPARPVLMRTVLERMIIDRAQLQMAKETGVRVDDATVNAAIARIAEQNGMSLPQFRERIDKEGVTFGRFREDIRDDIVMGRLRDREVDSKVQIGEGEIDNFLAEKAGVEVNSIEYEIAQILLRVPEAASSEAIENARKRAEDLLAQVRGGADFAKLAASYSSAPEALAGGNLGWRTAERLPTLFLDAIKDLKPGEVAQIVRSPGGFHLLKLLGKRSAVEAKLATGPVQQTRVRHILMRVSDVAPEVDVLRRLNDLRERVLKGGLDFGQLARLHSVDPSATRGGDLGWIYPGDTVPEFERAMNALAVGEVSEPVRTPFGWHLIQVLERRTDESPMERNRYAARQALRDRKADEAFQEWLQQLRDRTYVEFKLDES